MTNNLEEKYRIEQDEDTIPISTNIIIHLHVVFDEPVMFRDSCPLPLVM